MKQLFLLLTLTLSVSAHANTVESVFKKDSLLPLELQKRVLSAIEKKCQDVLTENGLAESATTVREDHIDNGIVDYYYTTTFSSRYYFADQHPTYAYFTVESAEYGFSNGDNLSVSDFKCERLF